MSSEPVGRHSVEQRTEKLTDRVAQRQTQTAEKRSHTGPCEAVAEMRIDRGRLAHGQRADKLRRIDVRAGCFADHAAAIVAVNAPLRSERHVALRLVAAARGDAAARLFTLQT